MIPVTWDSIRFHKMVEHLIERSARCDHLEDMRLSSAQNVRLFAVGYVVRNAEQTCGFVLSIPQRHFRGRKPAFLPGRVDYVFVDIEQEAVPIE